MNINPPFDEAGLAYQQTRMTHWNQVAQKRDHWRGFGRWYHRRIAEIYKFLVNPNQRILEIGCGMGSLISQLKPSHGVGVDFSAEMIARAKQRHPEIEYHQLDAHDLSSLEGTFDIIIFSDLVNDLWDVQRALEQVKKFCTPQHPPHPEFLQPSLAVAAHHRAKPQPRRAHALSKLAHPRRHHNMLRLAGFETIRTSKEVLWPLPLGGFADRFLVKLWPFSEFALSNFVIARPTPAAGKRAERFGCHRGAQ